MNFFDDVIKFDLKKDMGICNVTDEFFCVLLNKLNREDKNILVVVDSLFEANKLYSSLSNYTDLVYLFPMDDFLTSEALAISPDLMISRLECLNKINSGKKCIVITNLMGYLRFLPKKSVYLDSIIELKVGKVVEPSLLVSKLISIGYVRDTLVNKTGEFGVRGFVIDVFPIDEDDPIRIEFFDDEIESIRYFNPENQKSISSINSISIKPNFEFIVNGEVPEEEFGKQKYLQKYTDVCSISDYLDDTITIFKDYEQLKVSYRGIMNEIIEYRNSKDTEFNLEYMMDFNKIHVDFPVYYFSLNNLTYGSYVSQVVNFGVRTINSFNENGGLINDYINNSIASNKTVIIVLKQYQIRSVLKHLNMKLVQSDFSSIKTNIVNIVDGELNEGFVYDDIVVLTSKELFNIHSNKKKYNTKFKYSSAIKDINKLEIGDYVVHNVHGIGVYNGIVTLSSNNNLKDYLEILYAGTDKIYIPVEKISLISKYSGREGVSPRVNKLGGTEWIKTKRRVQAKVTDMADKLLKLYAERESRKGFAFSKDCDMSRDFEKDFPYELTTDQARAIEQIKSDMEKPVPMDRLLCGDVGFGKTEVAFVAAFKAILDSKQVLFLCPTTILSNQHYENAKVRFKNFPVNIGLLNRFTSSSEEKRILNGLKDGTIDMVFGTHRLLSDDIHLKDLGLLVIDEEQRFGVAHKEKIKQYKTNVDVLTLTATPIPRTLQMSLVGIRSLSLIETPPVNRYPVQTYVVEENKQILKDAI